MDGFNDSKTINDDQRVETNACSVATSVSHWHFYSEFLESRTVKVDYKYVNIR